MSWIKIETNLPSKTEVYALSHYLQRSRAECLGFLVRFWTWADKNTADGTLLASREVIDDITTEGFASAMVDIGWLDFTDDGRLSHLPNFDRHNGSSAKKRATTADRVRRHRNAKSVATSNEPSVSREEKRREKKKEKKGGW